MKVLVACEFSGVVRDAFAAKGHDAWSCDLLPTERPGQHYQDDVLKHLDEGWDLLIAHPPCTHIAVSGARHFKKKGWALQRPALELFLALLNAPVQRICVENPVSIASSHICRPTQIIQPWMFGHEETKTTCLWLKNLPKLNPTLIVNQGHSRVHKELASLPQNIRGHERSRTYVGVAEAMAEQWGRGQRPRGLNLASYGLHKINKTPHS